MQSDYDISSIIRRLSSDGYVFISRFKPQDSTKNVAERIGNIVDIDLLLPRSGIPSVQILRPRTEENAPKTHYSGVFGLNDFPLHTDLAHWVVPPRYFMLRCIRGSSDVATTIFSGQKLCNLVDKSCFKRALYRPRRLSRGGCSGLLPIYFLSEGEWGIRWDSLFLTPINEAATKFSQFMNCAENFKDDMQKFVLRNPGDTLIIDNWRVLHGRSNSHFSPDRIIERVYLGGINNDC